MGCASSTPLPSWVPDQSSTYSQLTLRTSWMSDIKSAAARLLLTVSDAGGTELMNLDGGYVYMDGGKCIPSHAIVSAPDGERWRAVCKMKAHDTWSWTLQTARSVGGGADGDCESDCSVCWSPFYQPTRFPASADAAHCEHIFCRECIVRCLSSGQVRHSPISRKSP